MVLDMAGQVAAGSFGVAAAVLLIGGGMVLRGQRERHRFQLAKAAIDRGMPVPQTVGPPAWVASLRQAVVILAVGAGLIAGGGLARGVAGGVATPTPAELAADVPPAPGIPGLFHPAPPRPNPALERWHFAQDEAAAGLAALAAGGVVALLGVVRIAFAVIERKYEPAGPGVANAPVPTLPS